jgi:hypothetical protein
MIDGKDCFSFITVSMVQVLYFCCIGEGEGRMFAYFSGFSG